MENKKKIYIPQERWRRGKRIKPKKPKEILVPSPNSIDNENLPDPETWTPFTQSSWRKDYRRALGDLSHPRTKFISSQALHTALTYTQSFRAAAQYLHVSPETLRKYARHYIEPESGLSYYELYKKQGKKAFHPHFGSLPRANRKPEITKYLQDIVEGKAPVWGIQHNRIKNRLIDTGLLKEECKMCGFHEKRLTDGKMPLILHHKNGIKEDFHLENIELLCYNCSFLYAESPITEKQVEEMEDFTVLEEGDPITWELSDFQKEALQNVGLLETGERKKVEYVSEEFRRRTKIIEKRREYYRKKQKEQGKKVPVRGGKDRDPLELEYERRRTLLEAPINWEEFEKSLLKEEKNKFS